MERFLYGLATLIFCIIPFLISGGAAKEGGIVFFAEIIILLAGMITFGIITKRNSTSNQSNKSKQG